MKKVDLTIDGKTVEITEKNIFSVIDMIMAAGASMQNNKSFSHSDNGVSMTFTATGLPHAGGARTFSGVDSMMKKLDEIDKKMQQFTGNNGEMPEGFWL